MSTIFCIACNAENHSNSVKCEQCKVTLSPENPNLMHDEWENDFLYIENAEMKGQIFKLEHFQKDEAELRIETTTTNGQIVQAIKEEPEFQIEPDKDFPVEEEILLVDTKKHSYLCNQCNKCFKRKASLLSHIKAFHCLSDDFDEDSSDTKMKQQLTLKSKTSQLHLRYQNKNESTQSNHPQRIILKCDLCNDSFANNNELKTHRNICVTKEKFFCDVCKIFVSSKGALLKHRKSRQHKYYLDSPPVAGGDKLKFVCLFCGERFPLQVLLTNHKKVHVEESKLLNETSRIEKVDGRITYTCTICGKSTSNKSGHTEHLRVHTKEKPVKCDLCGSAFTTRSSLVRHMNLHTDERPYKCNICDNTYRHKRNLRKHLFMHTGQRPYKCKYCDKTFALRFTFRDHVRLHTGETPYQCEECKQSFTTSYLLNFHRRKEHNIDTNTKPKVKILNKTLKSTEL